MTRKIIIDCDPGHDDVMAILLALAHPEELEILGYTTVCGNQLVEKVTANLAKVLTAIGKSGKIAMGCDTPLHYAPDPQPGAHGESGLDGPILPEATVKVLDKHAIEFMRDVLENSDKKITIVALGPLTNIAVFLKTYPHLRSKIECITLMGGSIYSGNILPKAEFNIYEDPHAAKIVFESSIPIIMSGLEVCNEASILHTEIDALQGNGKVQDLAHDILQFFSKYNRDRNKDRSPLFDVVPIMHLLHPEYFTSQKFPVHIEVAGEYTRGMTVVDLREPRDPNTLNAEVLTHCDRDKFMKVFLDALIQLDKN
ncbi:MAG: nucleoside hydrolase [Erysipelotrichaceae bacterium]|nr:nucleoside hydrolase [Erysipelotrichaceae bacterium]